MFDIALDVQKCLSDPQQMLVSSTSLEPNLNKSN